MSPWLMKTYRIELTGFGTQYINAEDWRIEDDVRRFRIEDNLIAQFAESMIHKVSEAAPAEPEEVFRRHADG